MFSDLPPSHGREAPPDLVSRAGTDRAAFGQLYDIYLSRVYAFCRKYTNSREEAEDLTALTFERALVAIHRYEDRGRPLSHWLLRIAANAVIDSARRQGREGAGVLGREHLIDDRQLEEWDEAYWLHTHIAQLPDDQRTAIYLRFYEDRRFADVARQMGRSEGAAKQLLRRALKALHLRIREETSEDLHDE